LPQKGGHQPILMERKRGVGTMTKNLKTVKTNQGQCIRVSNLEKNPSEVDSPEKLFRAKNAYCALAEKGTKIIH